MTRPAQKKAPTGRKTTAQGKEQSDAALGPPPPQTPSPEGAGQLSEWIPIGDLVTDDIDRKGPSGSEDFIYVDIGSVDRDSKLIIDPKSLPVAKAPSRAKQVLKSGDVLVSMTRPNLNAVAIVPPKLDGAIGSTGFHVLRASHADPSFLFYAVQTRAFIEAMCLKVQGALYPAVRPNDISSFRLPPIPLAEQRRIVAKIEELFSELDAGEESLRRARRQLGVYRQSLLKQAFEGKLTEQWRKQNSDKLIIPNVPAITIDKEIGILDSLPNGWLWTHLSNVGELGRGKSKHRPRNEPRLFGGPYPFIQTGEVKAASKTVKSFTETYSEFGLAQSKLWPKGTLCITIAANIAETAFLGFDGCFPDSVVGFVPITDIVNPEFIELFIRAARSRIEKYAPATAQKNINLTTLENLVIPLCSLPEQQEIVRLLDEQFTVIEQNEREIDAALKRSAALRQSILKKAFTGQLVPQDPTDEPASALLERIRNERTTHSTPKTIAKKSAVGRKS